MADALAIGASAVIGALPFPALLIGGDGNLAAVNRAASIALSVDPSAIGMPARRLRLVRQEQGLHENIAAAERGVASVPVVVRALVGGPARYLRLSVIPLVGEPGARSPFLIVGEETTGTIEDPPLRHDPDSRFLAMVAHELRNPLSAIVNALHIIRHRTHGDRIAARAVRIAERQVRHQARLLEDLLDASRLRLGKLELRPERLDLGEVVRDAVESARWTAESRAQVLTLATAGAPLPVRGDRTRLEQVLRNLLDNAVKYSNAGGRIVIEVGAAGMMAVVHVTDTGVGIEPGMLTRIFEPFTQGDPSAARGGLGVGLGLVRTLVEMHGGTVHVRSAGRGRGSTFEVRLPLDATPASAAVVTAPSPPPARARRILVIEDDRDAREVLQVVLELDGHRVQTAGDGISGVRIAAETAPDVVLVDIGLPEVDGYEVARRIKKRLGAAVKLVALTGYGDAQAHRAAREAGFDAHVVKPVTPEELARLLA